MLASAFKTAAELGITERTYAGALNTHVRSSAGLLGGQPALTRKVRS